MELAFISPPDLVIIFIVVLVIFGPNRLPEVGRQLGQAMRELRKVTGEFTDVFHGARDDFRQAVTVEDPPAMHAPAAALDQEYEAGLMERSAKLAGAGEDAQERESAGMVVSTVPPSEGEVS